MQAGAEQSGAAFWWELLRSLHAMQLVSVQSQQQQQQQQQEQAAAQPAANGEVAGPAGEPVCLVLHTMLSQVTLPERQCNALFSMASCMQ